MKKCDDNNGNKNQETLRFYIISNSRKKSNEAPFENWGKIMCIQKKN